MGRRRDVATTVCAEHRSHGFACFKQRRQTVTVGSARKTCGEIRWFSAYFFANVSHPLETEPQPRSHVRIQHPTRASGCHS